MKTTIHDVAKAADVSIATVSRVINNNYPVNKNTRIRVEKIIEELGYKPNEIARSLILKTTSNIGVIVPGLTNIFFPTIVEGINNELRENGFTLSLYTSVNDPEEEKKLLEIIMSRNMDGVIIIDPSVENLRNGFIGSVSKKIPTILISGKVDKYDYNFVSYDEEVGTLEAFQHLYDLGHRKILFIRGATSLSYDLKENSYYDFIRKNNLDYKQVLSVGKGNNMDVVEDTTKIFNELLSETREFTAVFACNDLMAVGVINSCNSAGIKIPEDLSVIGFDNTLLSNISNPKLTSVDLNIKKVAETAAREIISLSKNHELSLDKVTFDSRLFLRDSCAKPKGLQ